MGAQGEELGGKALLTLLALALFGSSASQWHSSSDVQAAGGTEHGQGSPETNPRVTWQGRVVGILSSCCPSGAACCHLCYRCAPCALRLPQAASPATLCTACSLAFVMRHNRDVCATPVSPPLPSPECHNYSRGCERAGQAAPVQQAWPAHFPRTCQEHTPSHLTSLESEHPIVPLCRSRTFPSAVHFAVLQLPKPLLIICTTNMLLRPCICC